MKILFVVLALSLAQLHGALLSKAQQNFEKSTASFTYHFRVDAVYKDSGGLKVYTAPFAIPGIRQLVFYDAAVKHQYVRVLSSVDVSKALAAECSKLKGCVTITPEQMKAELAAGRAS